MFFQFFPQNSQNFKPKKVELADAKSKNEIGHSMRNSIYFFFAVGEICVGVVIILQFLKMCGTVGRGKMGHFNWGKMGHVQARPRRRSLGSPLSCSVLALENDLSRRKSQISTS